MPESVSLELCIPRELGDPSDIRQQIRQRVEAAEERYAEMRRNEGRRVVGVRAIRCRRQRGSASI